MKVKIEKDGEVKEFNLIDKWEDVTLETYGKLIDFKEGSQVENAIHMLKSMTDIPKEYMKLLPLANVSAILSKIAEVQSIEHGVLQNIITIDGVNYGFHPKLDEITLGEYADIEHFIQDGYMKNFKEIMAVLYRPVTSRDGKQYSIEAYDGNITERIEVIKKMTAKQVQGALVFFWRFGSELLTTTQLYLMEENLKKQSQDLTEILQTNGDGSA